MTSKSDRIAELEKLLALRLEVEDKDTKDKNKVPESDVPETSDADATATIPQKPPLNGRPPMPPSLRGMSRMAIQLLAIDGNLSPAEQNWYNRLKGPGINYSYLGKNGWMAF